MASTTSTVPVLTGPQIDALLDIARHGDHTRIHPARREALVGRGLIELICADLHCRCGMAALTAAGRRALDTYTGTAV